MIGEPLCLPRYVDVIHMIQWTIPSPFDFCALETNKNQTVGRPGNEATFSPFIIRLYARLNGMQLTSNAEID